LRHKYIDCLCKEIADRKNYLSDNQLDTIYFGGGTPSLLSANDFAKIFSAINQNFVVKPYSEITLECNPDDLSQDYISMLKSFPFNRVSVGIQSFNDNELDFLNRRHNASSAKIAVKNLQHAGFKNISVDLMFGLPNQTLQSWESSINEAIRLNIQHISCYALSYEKGTKLDLLRKNNSVQEISDDLSEKMFELLIKKLKKAVFEHYEISNFCLPNFHSRHNSAYWQLVDYLGVGASAHSFNGAERRWNIANIEKYCAGLEAEKNYFETEILTQKDRYNEFIFLSLRTKKGLDLQKLKQDFGEKDYNFCLASAQKYLDAKKMIIVDNFLIINEKAIFISDMIMSDLMKV
jgi:oxygen-independent coproporphyrinogen-3 oxidase